MKVELRVCRDNYITKPGNLGNNAHYVYNKTVTWHSPYRLDRRILIGLHFYGSSNYELKWMPLKKPLDSKSASTELYKITAYFTNNRQPHSIRSHADVTVMFTTSRIVQTVVNIFTNSKVF
jgi:hypothetical protein